MRMLTSDNMEQQSNQTDPFQINPFIEKVMGIDSIVSRLTRIYDRISATENSNLVNILSSYL